MAESDLAIGTIVADREDSVDLAVVVNRPSIKANKWEVDPDGTTVADWPTNSGYAPDESVVIVAFLDAMRESHPEWDGGEPIAIAVLGPKPYAFPMSRLEPTGQEFESGDNAEPELVPEPPDELLAVADRLRTGGCEVEVSPGAVTASKLGESYVVRPDGTVDGDGVLLERLEAAVKEVLAR